MQSKGGKRLDLRLRRDAVFGTIAVELPADDVVHTEWPNSFEGERLLIAYGIHALGGRRLHGHERGTLGRKPGVKNPLLYYTSGSEAGKLPP